MRRNLILSVFIVFLFSCKKDVLTPIQPDYRDKFIGNYKCYCYTGAYLLGTESNNYDSIVNVSVTKNGDSSITIIDATLKLETNGEFSSSSPFLIYQGFGGHFSNDSVYFITSTGGLGVHLIQTYKGKKQ